MASTISTLSQTLEVTEVGDIVVSEAVADEDVGGYVRLIQIMDTSGSNPVLLVELKLRSDTQANLNINVPASEM